MENVSEKREKLCLTVVSVQEKSDIELKKKKKKNQSGQIAEA